MSEPLDLLTAHLKKSGFSVTDVRREVFMALQGQEPQTMQELASACFTRDRASVYRTVALFEKLGIVQRLQIGWKYKLELSGEFIHHHHHLSCTHCGKTFALPDDSLLEKRLHDLATSHDFVAQDHQVEIRGLCTDCHAV